GAEDNRHHLNLALRQARAKSLQKKMQRTLRRAIDVVALAAAIAGHGANHHDEAASLRLQLLRRDRQQRYGAGEVLLYRRERLMRVDLRLVFVAQRSEAQYHAVETAEVLARALDQLGMRGEVGRIKFSRD